MPDSRRRQVAYALSWPPLVALVFVAASFASGMIAAALGGPVAGGYGALAPGALWCVGAIVLLVLEKRADAKRNREG